MRTNITYTLRRLGLAGFPPLLTVVIALNVAASLLYWVSLLASWLFGWPSTWVSWLLALPAAPHEFIFRPWTLFTYMFVQADALQLLFNMLWLGFFGCMLCDTYGPESMLKAYVGGGFTGGICYIAANVLSFGEASWLMGSSAAILSVMVYTALRQPDRAVNLFLLGAVKLKWIALVTVVITLIGATGIPQHCAHIGGAAFPLLLLAYDKASTRKRLPRRRVPRSLNAEKPLRPVSPRKHEETPPGNQASSMHPSDENMLDSLLDKIRISGFSSLTEEERKLLNELSSKIDSK